MPPIKQTKYLLSTCCLIAAAVGIRQVGASDTSAVPPLFTGPGAPVVDLGYAKYQGIQDTFTDSANYLGIKFANAPRFDHASVFEGPVDGDVQDARDYGFSCPQKSVATALAGSDFGFTGNLLGFVQGLPFAQAALRQSEDCLNINIQRPSDMSISGLPVVVWIHGGGFQFGSGTAGLSENTATPGVFYQGAHLVKRSLEMKQPILFASINYRLNDFGFPASREMANAGLLNLGLEDQRVAFRWIQRNIAKVTIMGQSAGAWSVSAHLVGNGGDNEGLFSGAIALSGGPVKVQGPERQQPIFDDMVNFVDCGSASDKIDCLRHAPFEKLFQHAQTVPQLFGYQSLAAGWTIRPDGNFLPDSPDRLAAQGQIADVPLLIGDMRDEGTLFSLTNSLNVTTKDEVKQYFKNIWWPEVTEDQLDRLMQLYPGDSTRGSPFETGILYSEPAQYKRIAAITGDYSFESQRRSLLDRHSAPKWNYLTEQALPANPSDLLGNNLGGVLGGILGNLAPIPVLGSFHASDVILNVFGNAPGLPNTINLMSTLISFVVNQDPNKHGLSNFPDWPQWDSGNRQTMNFRDLAGARIIADDYRTGQMDFLNQNADSLRI